MDNNPRWVRLTEIFKDVVKAHHIIKELKKSSELTEEYEDKIFDNFNKIKLIEKRPFVEQAIPITASIREAIDIFYIVNASGVNLTDAELALAQISGYWPDAEKSCTKEKLSKLAKQGFVFNLDFIVYTLLGVMYNMATDMRKLHSDENKERIMEVNKTTIKQFLIMSLIYLNLRPS